MPVLKIKRTYNFTDSKKGYQIYLDGNLIGTIAPGETREFEATAIALSIF